MKEIKYLFKTNARVVFVAEFGGWSKTSVGVNTKSLCGKAQASNFGSLAEITLCNRDLYARDSPFACMCRVCGFVQKD